MKMALVTNLQPKKQLSAELKKFGITANQTSAVDSQAYVEGLKAYTKSAEYAKRLTDLEERLSPADVRRMIIGAGYGNTRGSSEKAFKKAQKQGHISKDADFTHYWVNKIVVEYNEVTIKALQQVIDQGVKLSPGKTDFRDNFSYVNHFYIPGSVTSDGLDNANIVSYFTHKNRKEKNKMLASESYYKVPAGGYQFDEIKDTASKYGYKNRNLAALHNLLYTLKYKRGWNDVHDKLIELSSHNVEAALRIIAIDGWDKWFSYDKEDYASKDEYNRVLDEELKKYNEEDTNATNKQASSNKSGT